MSLFPGFEPRMVRSGDVEIFAMTGGSGPPLLLLHGYPQTHAMWHKVAPALVEHFTLVIADLRGYGQSSAPADDTRHTVYAKRQMAKDAIALMQSLGHERFAVAGHDRGGRVAYRLALDAPERVTKLAVLDIVPTADMWGGMNAEFAIKVYHWAFLAQPAPLPETLIGAHPAFYLEWTLASWTKAKDLSAFDPKALAAYRSYFSESVRIAATCADYRAGATTDRAIDLADRDAGRKIACPVLSLWGGAGLPAERAAAADPERHPLTAWRRWADDVRGTAIDAGHFLPEEAPGETAAALIDFFR
ncbi:MAG: alpha/beta hydrolase [Hyphomicrobiales bacterium]